MSKIIRLILHGIFIFFCPFFSFGQGLSLSVSSTINTKCNGDECRYEGPSILINEIMIYPSSGDGSIYDVSGQLEGEWIELYNPNKCQSVDISCYFLGNVSTENNTSFPGGFVFPKGTIVPPMGFVIVRGRAAPPVPQSSLVQNGGNTVEIIIDGINTCLLYGGGKFWLPNEEGWLGIYDNSGIPQDAIIWGDPLSAYMTPCNPVSNNCSYKGTLIAYHNINGERKNKIASILAVQDKSFRRFPDGGQWDADKPADPTYGKCNSQCNYLPVITCNGTATVVISGGVPPCTIEWDDGMEQETETATGLCEGMYCVTVTDANNNTKKACVQVDDYKPNISLSGLQAEYCINEEVTFFANGSGGEFPYSYKWNGPRGYFSREQNPVIQEVSSLDSGNYVATVYDKNKCFRKDTVRLNVKNNPYIYIAGKTKNCVGDTVILYIPDSSLLNGIEWEGPNGLSHNGGKLVIYNALKKHSGSYTVKAKTINGCDILPIYTYIDVFPAPVFDLGPSDTSSCDEIILDVKIPYARYEWNTGDSTRKIVAETPGTYSVKVTNRNGCTRTDTINVLASRPTLKIEIIGDLCLDRQVQLRAVTNANTIEWITGETTEYITVTDTNHRAFYWVRAYDGVCDRYDTVEISFTRLDVKITTKGNFCKDQTMILKAETAVGANFTWSGLFDTTQEITIDKDNHYKIYWVYVSKGRCKGDISYHISIPPPPTFTLTKTNDLCPDTETYLEVVTDPTNLVQWSRANETARIVEEYNPGIYWVTVEDTNGCINDGGIEVFLRKPAGGIQSQGDLCRDGQVVLTAQAQTSNFEWNTNEYTRSIIVNKPGIYIVKATDQNGCFRRDTIKIERRNPLKGSASAGYECRDGQIVLKVFTSNTPMSILWSTGANSEEIIVNTPGKYWVTLNDNGCIKSDTIEVDSLLRPPVIIKKKGDLCRDDSVTLRARTYVFEKIWNTGDTLKEIVIDSSGVYWVEVNRTGCLNRDTITVDEIIRPHIEIEKDGNLCKDGQILLKIDAAVNDFLWNTGDTVQQIIVTLPGKYWAMVNDDGCKNYDTIDVQEETPDLEILTRGDLCEDRYLVLIGETSAPVVLWSTGDSTREIIIQKSGEYWIEADQNGCINRDTILINVIQPVAAIISDKLPLEGCEPFLISFENHSLDVVKHLWKFGDGRTSEKEDPAHEYLKGNYQLIYYAYSEDNCMDSIALDIDVYSTPKPDFYWEPLYPTAKTPKIQLINKTSPDAVENIYKWKIQEKKNNSQDFTLLEDTIHPYFQWKADDGLLQGKYKIELRSSTQNLTSGGLYMECADSLLREVRIMNDFLQFPNIVTPNGDGINDIFKIVNLIDGMAFPENELIIYDRAGKKVYYQKNMKLESDYWDPNVTNTPPGTYFYRFTGKSHYADLEYAGSIEILK